MRRTKTLLLVLSSMLLAHGLCLADAPTPTPTTETDQQAYDILRSKLLSDCANVDQVLKKATPTINQLNVEIAASHQSEADYIKSKNAKATNAVLDKLTSQYFNHLTKIQSLAKAYQSQLDPSMQILIADEDKLQPLTQLAKGDLKLLNRLRATGVSIMAPFIPVSDLAQPVKLVVEQELADQKVDPTTLTNQQVIAATRHAVRALLDGKAVESNLTEVTDQNYAATITNSKIPVLVYFGSAWSKNCRLLAPELIKAAKQYKGKLTIVRLDVDKYPEVADEAAIEKLPSIIITVPHNNQAVGFAGLLSYDKLTAFIDSALDPYSQPTPPPASHSGPTVLAASKLHQQNRIACAKEPENADNP